MSTASPLATVSLRPMTEGDIDLVASIERLAYEHPWTPGIFHDCLGVGYSCWLMQMSRRTVGYGILSAAAGEAHILNLCIHPSEQRRGLGRHLLGHLLDLSRRHHAEIVLLEVRPSNRAALALYEAAGFNEVGVRRNYYPAVRGREDALILAMDLSTGAPG